MLTTTFYDAFLPAEQISTFVFPSSASFSSPLFLTVFTIVFLRFEAYSSCAFSRVLRRDRYRLLSVNYHFLRRFFARRTNFHSCFPLFRFFFTASFSDSLRVLGHIRFYITTSASSRFRAHSSCAFLRVLRRDR